MNRRSVASARIDTPSESIESKLLDILYEQRAYIVFGTLGLACIALLGYVRTGQPWFCWWSASSIVLLAGRMGTTVAFSKRVIGAGRPGLWHDRFLIGLWVNGASCGVGAALSILWTDELTQLFVLMMVTTFVMGSASRNSPYPRAAIGSVLLAEVPSVLGCLASREVYHMLFTPFVVVFTFSALGMTRSLYNQTVRFLQTDEARVALVADITRTNAELAVANDMLAITNAKLGALAGTDGLTGVPNRRSFDTAFEIETRSAQSDGSQLSILMFDIDSFKAYNDYYGHPAGDDCLRLVARELAAGLGRPRDLLARYGGEEFVAILPQTDLAGALAVAEARRAAIEGLAIAHAGSGSGIVTVSIGVATFSAEMEASAVDVLRRSDEALYVAKRDGRNRVHGITDEAQSIHAAIIAA